MNKTKKTLIFSSAMMALVLVVTIVGVTAAWFGNVTSQSQTGFKVNSAEITSFGSIDIDETTVSGIDIYPALATRSYFTLNEAELPTGKQLLPTDPSDKTLKTDQAGLARAAKAFTIHFTIEYIGSPDVKDGSNIDGRKSVKVQLDDVYLLAAYNDKNPEGTTKPNFDGLTGYGSEFDCDMCVVTASTAEDVTTYDIVPSAEKVQGLSGTEIYYRMLDAHTLGLRILPGRVYTIEYTMYFNKIDEECNQDLIGKDLRLRISIVTNDVTISEAI